MEPAPEEGPGRSFGSPDLTLTGAIDRLALERAVADLAGRVPAHFYSSRR